MDSKVTFKFTKKTEEKVLTKSSLESIVVKDEDKSYITNYNGNDFKKSKDKSKLVIPLVHENKWRNCSEETNGNLDDITKEALKELLQNPSSVVNNSSKLEIPILIRNKVPGETENRPNFAVRPEVDDRDYEDVSIEEFGYAMLRGMGWKDGEFTSRIVEAGPRRTCLGLTEFAKKNESAEIKREEEEKQLGPHCIFVTGANKGKYGMVISDSAERIVVEMALSKQKINTISASIKMVSKREYEKNQRYLNNSEVDKYKEKEAEKDGRGNRTIKKEHSEVERKIKKEHSEDERKIKKENSIIRVKQSRSSEDDEKSKKRKREVKDEKEESREMKPKLEKNLPSHYSDKKIDEPWLHPQLVVRIVDKNYKKGKHYKEKVIIEDVTEPLVCVCRTSENRLLEGLNQNMLETVIPREVPSLIMVVKGKYKFQNATVLHKDKDNCKVMVNLISDEKQALTLDFDDVCQYSESDLRVVYNFL